MPPINQQGSRTGLITALVVFVILFVVSIVFAFNYYGRWQQALLDNTEYQKRYTAVVSEADLASAPVLALPAAKAEQPSRFQIVNSPTFTSIDTLLHQRDGLAAAIVGGDTNQSATAVYDAAVTSLKSATDKLAAAGIHTDVTGGGLTAAISRLAEQVVADQTQIKNLTKRAGEDDDQIKTITASIADINAKNDAAAKAAAQTASEAQAQLQTSIEGKDAANKALTDAQAASVATNLAAAQQSANQVADIQRQLKTLQVEIEKYRDRQNRRPYVDDAAIRVADGQLIRVPGNNVCYINLGYGTGVTNGLTFEVYDKLSGVPPLPPSVNGDEQLPIGKASIEIIHVGQNSSECRIVHTDPGAVLVEGDVIENLVYDAHQRYKFDVFGDFDLAKTGRPNPADAEVIKRLVTQWGGSLIDKISPDTDFLVLGAEPVLPEFAKDDLTPENQDKLQKAQDALEKYNDVRQQAKDLHIPVLNQNRFLYYVGYYDQATR